MALPPAPSDSAPIFLWTKWFLQTNLILFKKKLDTGRKHWILLTHPIGTTICFTSGIITKNFLLLPPDSYIGYQRAWFHNDIFIMTPNPSNKNNPRLNTVWLQQCCFPSKNLGKLVTLLQTNSSTSRWLKKNAKRYRHRQETKTLGTRT